MKRPFKPTVNYQASLGIAKADFTKDQFAGIGHVAMAYNDVEESLYNLFGLAAGLTERMLAQVFTRIGGIDGVVAIICRGAAEAGLSVDEMEALQETLGAGAFGKYKTYRDAIIHARSYNAPAGIGVRLERRARWQEVLMTAEALEILASHLAHLAHEITYFDEIVAARLEVTYRSSDDPEREQFEEVAATWMALFRDCRNRRLALPPLPEFPAEEQLLLAQGEWRAKLPSLQELPPKDS